MPNGYERPSGASHTPAVLKRNSTIVAQVDTPKPQHLVDSAEIKDRSSLSEPQDVQWPDQRISAHQANSMTSVDNLYPPKDEQVHVRVWFGDGCKSTDRLNGFFLSNDLT